MSQTAAQHRIHQADQSTNARSSPSWRLALLAIVLPLFAVFARRFFSSAPEPVKMAATNGAASEIKQSATGRAPVWFISHGGPPTLFEPQHAAHKKWVQLGKEIRAAQPKGIVIVSAHWQAEELREGVFVNVDEKNPLIYDFFGFPSHYYSAKFISRNPPSFSSSIMSHLSSQGIQAQPTKRGPDHGVWVPLKAGFVKQAQNGTEDGLPDSIPLCQVSLPRAETPEAALRLGRALRGLREQGIAVVGGGQAVHNLREMFVYMQRGPGAVAPYAKPFASALTAAVVPLSDAPAEQEDSSVPVDKRKDPKRWDAAKSLFLRSDYKKAHPTPEHLLPALVSLGAAYDDEQGKELFSLDEGTLSWNMYRWG